jgi:predicted dienelactone hydrolase
VVAVSLAVPVGVIFTPESLSRIRIPVGLSTAGNDGVLVPRFHSQHVLRHCKTCTTLSDHPKAGHFDWLSPWPASVAQTVAATQMRGGLPNPDFSPEERQKAFEQIALFFKQKL